MSAGIPPVPSQYSLPDLGSLSLRVSSEHALADMVQGAGSLEAISEDETGNEKAYFAQESRSHRSSRLINKGQSRWSLPDAPPGGGGHAAVPLRFSRPNRYWEQYI